ncbi:MAG: response regulator transcription factor [Chloroflexi bacterium]|nr:response regulator transcription factor [Chloroflexota bacterium]
MSTKRKRILLLDDDHESMSGLQFYLEEEMGWEVDLTAEQKLLERLGREKFDLLIVDLMIRPKGITENKKTIQNIHFDNVKWDRTGAEFVRRFRQGAYFGKGGTSPDVPIIVLSAVADSAADEQWGDIIRNEHPAEKPFRLSDMVALIRSLLQE